MIDFTFRFSRAHLLTGYLFLEYVHLFLTSGLKFYLPHILRRPLNLWQKFLILFDITYLVASKEFGHFVMFCGPLRIYELYQQQLKSTLSDRNLLIKSMHVCISKLNIVNPDLLGKQFLKKVCKGILMFIGKKWLEFCSCFFFSFIKIAK